MTVPGSPPVAAGVPVGGAERSGPGRAGRAAVLPPWALLPLAAAVWWVGGHLWWLLAGLDGRAAGGPALALPLDASTLASLVLGGLAGGVGAGLLARLGARRSRAVLATGGGVALAVAVGLLQSTAAAARGSAAGTFAAEPVVLAGLSAVVGAAAAAGWALGACALLGRAGLGVALGLLAGVVPPWLSAVLSALLGPAQRTSSSVVDGVSSWSGAVVLLLALVAVGLRPWVRLAVWPLVVALAWCTGPVLTAAVWLGPLLRPGAGLPGTLPDSLSGAWQVFLQAASPEVRDLVPWVVALVGGLAVAALADRSSSGAQ